MEEAISLKKYAGMLSGVLDNDPFRLLTDLTISSGATSISAVGGNYYVEKLVKFTLIFLSTVKTL